MINALLIPLEGDPEVVSHESWDVEAICTALDVDYYVSQQLEWAPLDNRRLVLNGPDGEGPPNPAAVALSRDHGWLFTGGPLLLTSETRFGRPASLTRVEVLLVGTCLLVGETRQRAITS